MTSLRQAHQREMAKFREARQANDTSAAWRALERAHILSQPVLSIHMRTHCAMLKHAFQTRNGREIAGQLTRLALAPFGSLTGRIPVGNTGRANVSAFKSMPIPDDLRATLDRAET